MLGDSNLILIFMTGLLTGGLTCLAVQGGLLAATIAQREEERLKERMKQGAALPIVSFLGAKLLAYTVLGALLGWFGSLFDLSITARAVMQFAIAIFMLGTALSILNVHPLFHYFIIRPPKFLLRAVRNKSKSKAMFAPAILGAFTVFIPCGTTQAMMALAMGSGDPFEGAAVLFAFVLGTSPLFFVLGYFATKLGDSLHKQFMKYAAYAIILLALYNINSGIALAGSRYTITNILKAFACSAVSCDSSDGTALAAGINQNWTINIQPRGYNPSAISVRAGQPVKLNLVNKDAYTCAQAFVIPRLGIQRLVRPGTSDTVEFVAPKNPGKLVYSCSMGMYSGIINVL